MIPTFTRLVERQYHIYCHHEVDEILDHLTRPVLEGGAVAKIAGGTHISETTRPDWHRQKLSDESWFPLPNRHPRARALNPSSEAAIADFQRANSRVVLPQNRFRQCRTLQIYIAIDKLYS
jgi:hypothetical protein